VCTYGFVQCTYQEQRRIYHVNFYWYMVQMKAVQLRMARAAVGWGVRELADRAGVTANTVTRIENGADAKQSTMDALQRALEAAGLEFINGEQPGVRLRKGTSEPFADAPNAGSARKGGRRSSERRN
jgi:transcriptional regulator with XRE-family HTH domain